MTHEDLYFLAAVGSVSVQEKMDVWVFPIETRVNDDYEEQRFKDIDCRISMSFRMADITSFIARMSMSFSSPVNGKWMCYDVEIPHTVSDLLSFSKLDYVKMLAATAWRKQYWTIQEELEQQIVSVANSEN